MDLTIRLTCPMCGTRERMPIPSKLGWLARRGAAIFVPVPNAQQATRLATAALCPECKAPFGVTIDQGGNSLLSFLAGVTTSAAIDQALEDAVIKTVPEGQFNIASNPDLPPLIRESFVFIQEDVARRRNAPGIMSGARACLDVALKQLGESKGGRRERIDNLAKRGIITTALADWSHSLWEEGSDAVHDLTADMDRAVEHVEFLKLLFEVVFELPAKIAGANSGANP